MLNKLGTSENMIEYHPNGNMSYYFRTFECGAIEEAIFNKHGDFVILKSENGYINYFTYNEQGEIIAYKDSDGYYQIKDRQVTKEEYDAFILSLQKPKEEPKQEPMKTAMQELIYEIQQEIRKSAQGENLTNRTGEYRIGLSKAIGFVSDKLEKEKAEIIDAHINGQSEFDILEYRDINISLAEQYYNQTYNQNK